MYWRGFHQLIAWRLQTTGKPILLPPRKPTTTNRQWMPSLYRIIKHPERITSAPHTGTIVRNPPAGKSLVSIRARHHPPQLIPFSSSPLSSLSPPLPLFSPSPPPSRPRPTPVNLPAESSPGPPPSFTSARACRKSTRTTIGAQPRAFRPRFSPPPSRETCSTAPRSSPTPWRGRRTRRTVFTAGLGPRGAIGERGWLSRRPSGLGQRACWCWTPRSGCSFCGSARAGRKRGRWCGKANGDDGTG